MGDWFDSHFLKSKGHRINSCYHAASLHFVLNIFHTLDFCLHTTSSFSKAIKGLSAHWGASKVVRREGQRQLLVECGNTEQQDLLYPPCSVPSVLIQTRVSSQEQDSALQSSVTGTSPSVVCPQGPQLQTRKEAEGSASQGLLRSSLEIPDSSWNIWESSHL